MKNLASKKFSKQFSIVLDSLEDAGYNNYWKILNAKDYEIPQNRERIIIVSIRKDLDSNAFTFPEPVELQSILLDVLEDEVDEKYYVDSSKVKALIPQLEKKEISNTIRASGGEYRQTPVGFSGKACVTLSDYATELKKVNDVADCICARDYKGFGRQEMNGVVEIERK